ncbi:MAG TPA: sulfite exporter TauE/SafE family protein [Thermoanaerobaculia bacterium]
MRAFDLAALVAAGAGAGVMNALAGGGTLLSFPVLVLLGVPAKIANATSTVALVPGALSSFAGYWPEVRSHRKWLAVLLVPSLVGGALGSLLLLLTPERAFARLAPWLVLFATALFAWQSRRGSAGGDDEPPDPAVRGSRGLAVLAQLGVALYGGYFGAGIGILMLAILAALGLSNIHAMNGLKNFFGSCINGVAAAIFLASGTVDWRSGLPLLVGAVAGGYAGARFGRRIGRDRARRAVILVGLLVTVILLTQQI